MEKIVKYGIIDGSKNTVLKYVWDRDAKQLLLFLWNGKSWITAPTYYDAIFTGEIQLNYIKEGDNDWTRLNLQK